MGSDYWKCPNTGRILASSSTDNKASCTCGKSNPSANGLLKETFDSGVTNHYKFLLQSATEKEWEAQVKSEHKFLRNLEDASKD